MAAGTATTPVDQDQTGGQDRRLGVKLFEASLEMAADQGGMFGDLKECPGARAVRVHIG
jgi:hypothetical protein